MDTHQDDAGGVTDPLSSLVGWLRSGRLPHTLAADAEALVECATAQGLAGMLHAEAARQQVGWPAPVTQRLRRRHLADVCGVALQLEAAAAVHRRLLAGGLRSLPLKGAAVAETLYGPGERPMGDVDLLVLDDFPAALETLARDGWRVEETADHAVSLRSAETPVQLELHRAAASCPGLHPLDAEGLWQRSWAGTGQLPRLPSPEDLLVLLSLHAAFQHALGLRLVQYLDLQRLLRTPLEVPLALEVATRARAAASVALTLAATRIVLGPLHPGLEAAFAPQLPRGLARWLAARADGLPALLGPAARDVARVRWGLARGRRARLLLETVSGGSPRGWRPLFSRGWRLGRRLLQPRPGQAP